MKVTVLYIEDNEDDARMLYHVLNKKGLELDYTNVKTLREAMAFQPIGKIDIIFVDLHLPDSFGGVDALRRVVAKWPDVATIVLSGHFSENMGLHLSHEGSMDEIDKSQITMDDRMLGRKIVAAMQKKAKSIDDQQLIAKLQEAFERNTRMDDIRLGLVDPKNPDNSK